jgi:hypothetical protein
MRAIENHNDLFSWKYVNTITSMHSQEEEKNRGREYVWLLVFHFKGQKKGLHT